MAKSRLVGEKHACVFEYHGHELAGSVYFAASGRTKAEIFDVPASLYETETDDGVKGASFPQEETLPVLRGQLREGRSFALVDPEIFILLPERAYVSCNSSICGIGLPEALTFDRIAFQVGGLTELFGTRPILRTRWPKDMRETGAEFGMEWNPAACAKANVDDYELELNFEVRSRIFDPYNFSVTTKPVIHIEGPRLSPQGWIDKFVEPIRALAELATSRVQAMNWMTLNYKYMGSSQGAKYFSREFNQEPYDAEESDARRSPIFTFASGTESSLEGMLDRWHKMAAAYPTFIDLYKSAMRDDLNRRSHFLVLMPALESFHAAEVGVEEVPKEQYKAKLQEVFTELKGAAISDPNPRVGDELISVSCE